MILAESKKKEKERKKARLEWATRKEPLTPEEINSNFNEYVNIILTPNANDIYMIDLDFGDLQSEIWKMTKYVDMLLQIIKLIPIECKYYFIDILDFNKCFVAIRQVFVRFRKDYNDVEEPLDELLIQKYFQVDANIKKKMFRPPARQIFFFLDRRIPMDLVMYKVIEMNEIMRNEETKNDPILQTKNSDMLKFTSGMRHQCTLVRNLVFSYLYTVSKVKTIFESFRDFFNDFSDFDKDHKDYYHKAKEAIGNQEFHEDQGIEVIEVFEDIKRKSKKEKKDGSKKSGSKASKEEESEEKTNSEENEKDSENESSHSSEEQEEDARVILPENLGKNKNSLIFRGTSKRS